MLVGALIFDQPYGIARADWDEKAMDNATISLMLKQFDAVNSLDSFIVVFWVSTRDLGRVMTVMEEHGLSNVQSVFWYKEDQNMTGDPRRFISSVEVMAIGFRTSGDASNNINNLSKNPLERHNIVVGPGLHTYSKHSDGTRVNIHQKPTYLAKWIVDNFARTDDTILICGHGAGGEVYGCVEGHCNVVCMDSDEKQVAFLRSDLQTADARIEAKVQADAAKVSREEAQAAKDASAAAVDPEEPS